MSDIIIESGSSSVPPLQRVEKGPTIVPELIKVGQDTQGVENAPMDLKTDSIPPLTPVSKSSTLEASPLTKVEDTKPADPPPLTKVESKPVEAPPLTLVKTAAPANIPELKVAVKKEFIGLVFEVDDEGSIILNKAFYGNDAKELVSSAAKVEALVKSICLVEYEKEVRRKKHIYQTNPSAGQGFSNSFIKITPPQGLIKFCNILTIIKHKVLVSEDVSQVDPYTHISTTLHSIYSAKTFFVISIENGQDLSMSINPLLINLSEVESNPTQVGFPAEFRDIENKVAREN